MGKLIKVWDGSTWQDVSVLAASSADKVSKSGGDTITSVTANTKGLIIKGAASQTADLQQWQNSAGTVLANVDSSGNIYTSSTTIWAGYNRATDGSALYNFTSVAGANYAQASIVRESGFNGNLRIDQQGNGAVLIKNGSAAGIGLIVKGYASQTANLQQWQNGAGTVLANVDSAGKLTAIPNDGTISTAATNVGYMGIPQNSITTGAYTVVAADAGEHIYSSATRTITIDSNANLALPVGTVVTFISGAGATTTIAITSDTMYLAGAGTTGSRTLAPHGMATAVKVASTTWYISGNGLT